MQPYINPWPLSPTNAGPQLTVSSQALQACLGGSWPPLRRLRSPVLPHKLPSCLGRDGADVGIIGSQAGRIHNQVVVAHPAGHVAVSGIAGLVA